MAQTKYTYSITNDTANALLAADALKEEILASAIVVAIDYIASLGDVLDIYMKDALSTGDKTILDGVVAAHTGVPLPGDPSHVEVEAVPPFSAKKIRVNGVLKSLFKRVHGVKSSSISAGGEVDIDLVVPYAHAKFTGAEIFGTELGDTLKFYVLDDATNTYSGAPTTSPGYPNYILNQFGFDVEMPVDRYKNTSEYDADLYQNMVVRCKYKNNGANAKTISMNVWLNEVKD